MSTNPPNARALDRVADLIESHMAETGVAGAALAVTRAGSVITTRCFGLADVDAEVPVDSSTLFQIGACTMTYTAMGILKLQDQGKLKINLPLRAYRQFDPGTRAHGFGKIPLARFLSMSGGLPDIEPTDVPWKEALQTSLSPGPRYVPGSRNLFSHPSFWLLGSLIETVTEEPWDAWIEREVIGELGLSDTRVGAPKKSKKAAIGYRYLPISQQYKVAETVPATATHSSGAIVASIEGLAQYMVKLDEGALLSERAYRALFQRVPLRTGRPGKWALGWEVRDPENVAGRWGVHGDIPGFDSTLLRAPKSGFSVVLVSNTADTGLERMALRILHILERGR